MNLFKRELKAHRKSLIFWCVGVVILIAFGMEKYGGFSGTGQSINELMSEMPKSLQAIMGTNSFDLSTAIGYYGLLYLYLVVMATIHASMLGANIIAKEERDKTTEFLLVKPMSRHKIITSKLIATSVNIIIFNVVTFLTSIVMVQRYSNGEEVLGEITSLMVGMLILQLIFMSVGTAIAALKTHSKTAASVSTGILLVTFILSIVIDMNERIGSLKYFTPFKYYDAKNILAGNGFEIQYIVISIVLTTGLTVVTYFVYKRRDLSV